MAVRCEPLKVLLRSRPSIARVVAAPPRMAAYLPLLRPILAGSLAALVMAAAPLAHAEEDPAQLFANTCAGCHAGGGNIVKRDATLALDDLKKYGLDSPDALYQIIYSGRGSMPGYGEGCAPKGACTFGRRLADEDVKVLASYVLRQAEAGWPS